MDAIPARAEKARVRFLNSRLQGLERKRLQKNICGVETARSHDVIYLRLASHQYKANIPLRLRSSF